MYFCFKMFVVKFLSKNPKKKIFELNWFNFYQKLLVTKEEVFGRLTKIILTKVSSCTDFYKESNYVF